MIVKIKPEFLKDREAADICDIAVAAVGNGHLIDCDGATGKAIRCCVNEHAGTTDRAEFNSNPGKFDIPDNLRKYLHTYEVPDTINKKSLIDFLRLPARLVIENANNEWPLYRHIIDLYKNDSEYGDYFILLKKAKDKGWIEDAHAGGRGELIKTASGKGVSVNGENIRLQRTCILFDRDTDNNASFSGNHRALFQYLTGKKHDEVSHSDLFTLKESVPRFHMWYKRAIENYIPNEQYSAIGCDATNLEMLSKPDKSYRKIEGKNTKQKPEIVIVGHYDKNKLPQLANGLSKEKLMREIDTIDVDGQQMHEMHLFLLRLVKII